MSARVVLASRNDRKLTELRRILTAAGVTAEVVGPEVFSDLPEIAETGSTFARNALLKAVAVARHTGEITIADDSGLCVDALNWMPGVLSARWAGGHSDDAANLALLLDQMRDVPDDRRGARFCCAAVVAFPDESGGISDLRVAHGVVVGSLTRLPRGTRGFGYDPIFVPDGGSLTTAELSSEAKDAISHRGRALRVVARVLASHSVCVDPVTA